MASRLQALQQEQSDLRRELRSISDLIDREAGGMDRFLHTDEEAQRFFDENAK